MGKAVVLGASSGIGRAFAERLISEGWSVGTGSRRTELLEELRKAAPDRVFTESIDVRESGAEEALLGLIGKLGGMDLLFYAPGVGHQNPDLDPEIELSTVETNALGFTRIIGAAYRYMAGHGGGHIAAVSSIAGFRGLACPRVLGDQGAAAQLHRGAVAALPCPRCGRHLHRDPAGVH